MLRITADVNGYPIGRLFIHNTGPHKCKTPRCGLWSYDAATWDEETQNGVFGIEGVIHQRSEPWLTLLLKVAKAGGLK